MQLRIIYLISNSPDLLLTSEGFKLGEDIQGNPVSIDPDNLDRHLLILGKTGTGKSNIMVQLVNAIVDSGAGSIALFDPHGELSKLVSTYYPENAVVITQETVPTEDGDTGITLNAISTDNGDIPGDLAVSWVKDSLSSENSLSHGTWGPRLEVVFTSLLSEIMQSRENASLIDLLELLTDTGKMRRFISGIEDEHLKSFLKMQVSDWRNWNQYVSSSINKLLPLLTNRNLRRLISSRRDSVNIPQLLEKPGTVLIPEIWRDVVSEDTYRVMTTLLLLKIWLGRLGKNYQTPLFLFFDEAQLVPTKILDKLLREGRKYGIHVIMATQYLGRELVDLSETLRGNVSNVISFSLLNKDADLIASNFFSSKIAEQLSDVLKNQTIHRAVIWTQGEDGVSGPLSFDPNFENEGPDPNIFEQVKNQSILKYGELLEKPEPPKSSTELHEYLIEEMQKFLAQKSIQSDRNVAVEGIYPDLFFTFNSRTYYVEVEVSDLVNFRRIWKKTLDYSGKPLIFLTPPGYGSEVFKKILDKLSELGDGSTSFNDLLGNVSIIEFHNGFRFFASGKTRQLRMDMLQSGSYNRTMGEQRHGEIRNFIYSRMLKNNKFRIQFPMEEVVNTFGSSNAENAYSYLCGNSKFITVKDLFRVIASD